MNSAWPKAHGTAGLPGRAGEMGFFLTNSICCKQESDGTGNLQVSKGSGAVDWRMSS